MINRIDLDLILQIIETMDEASQKMEKAYNDKDTKTLEIAKREVVEFQKKLSREIRKS